MNKKLNLALIGVVCLLPLTVHSQTFAKVTPVDAVKICSASCFWLDYDNDRDLDFIIGGELDPNRDTTLIYENKGSNIFEPAVLPGSPLPRLEEHHMFPININGDDRIDILSAGAYSRLMTIANKQTGFEVNLFNYTLASSWPLVATGDINHDARTDFFIAGMATFTDPVTTFKSAFFLQQSDLSFTETPQSSIKGFYVGTALLADIDNDGDLDLFEGGSLNNNAPLYQPFELYRNNGLGQFTKDAQTFAKLSHIAMDVVDADNDHDLDLLVGGYGEGTIDPSTILYRNTNGIFTPVTGTGIEGEVFGTAQWGDFDNDGDADLLMMHMNGPQNGPKVFRNLGNLTFEQVTDPLFTGLRSGFSAWADYDDDGDLDILVNGITVADERMMFVIRSESVVKNTPPSVPGNFIVTKSGQNDLTLSWSAATDTESSQNSLTYNLEVTATKGCDEEYRLSGFSHADGKRKVANRGNAGLSNQWKFNNLEDGRYTMRVQAIDGGFMGSAFAQQLVYIGVPAAPSDLTACLEAGKINLTWHDNAVNEENFILERAFGTGPFMPVGTPSYCITDYLDTYTVDGYYRYRIRAVNPNGTSDYSPIVSIYTVPEDADVDLGPDRVICNQAQLVLDAGNEFDTFQWNTGTSGHSLTIKQTGLYWVKAFAGCQQFVDSVFVEFSSTPFVDLGPDIIQCEDEPITLTAGDGFDTYRWHDLSTQPQFITNMEGEFSVEVTNTCGAASDTLRITRPGLDAGVLKIPNIFTPNGDRFNEYFNIGPQLAGSSLIILNRWGRRVKVFNNYQNNWNADDVPAGMYYYEIQYQDPCKIRSFKGWLTIVK